MVILTMLIERFHVSAEEDGLMYTVKLAAGTLLVAVLCYLVLGWERGRRLGAHVSRDRTSSRSRCSSCWAATPAIGSPSCGGSAIWSDTSETSR